MDNTILTCDVKQEWVDYNGHMNDAEYARVFSLTVDQLMQDIGIDADFREKQRYTIFTLETHVCYLDEAHLGEKLHVTLQLLDSDAKRMHVFFTMKNASGKRLATSEQMLMGMDMEAGRPAPFPDQIAQSVEAIALEQKEMPQPKEAGRTIGIKRKK
ncbi:thioesterase family protein [Virgibacillus halophilus]|uniref:Thioesterase family protein n=1 Tax=Tigheibacillus halophilus TaxID=361280 RepID=A0ABU5C8S0_9BACI|nr:thioesterase family protein [Virgibacillus halophilus]